VAVTRKNESVIAMNLCGHTRIWPRSRFMVEMLEAGRNGINYVPSQGIGTKNLLEFPLFPGFRAGIAYPSLHENRATTWVHPKFKTWVIDNDTP